MNDSSNTKKSLILQAARQIGVQKWTPAEIDQLRRRLIAEHGEAGKTGSEYIADVLEAAGLKLELTLQEEAEDQYEEEFEDLLHFKTLEDAEVSVMRLDELMRKFRSQGEHAAVVTLASLVERETPKPEERPLVAGVFENRLHKNMLLQCDPTVIYALEQQGRYNGTISTADLHIDSPYNSYTHTGLPPGPIGNPGEASLRAAYQPAHTNYLYFVANTQGGHFFSATLAEHNNNVIKYRHLLAGEQASNR